MRAVTALERQIIDPGSRHDQFGLVRLDATAVARGGR